MHIKKSCIHRYVDKYVFLSLTYTHIHIKLVFLAAEIESETMMLTTTNNNAAVPTSFPTGSKTKVLNSFSEVRKYLVY